MALVGLVAVSHSQALAEAAVELSLQMLHGDPCPRSGSRPAPRTGGSARTPSGLPTPSGPRTEARASWS